MKVFCKYCGQETEKTRENKIFCSPICRGNNWARKNRNKHTNNICFCAKCGEKYKPDERFPNYKFCSDCKGTIRYKGMRNKELMRQKKYRGSFKGKLTRLFLQLKRQRQIKFIKESFDSLEWFLKLYHTHGFCPSCDKCVGIDKLTKDHIIPISKVSKGFVYSINDVQPLCRSCNSSKNNKIIGGKTMKVFQGTDKEHYMDGYLNDSLNTAKEVIKKDWDNRIS